LSAVFRWLNGRRWSAAVLVMAVFLTPVGSAPWAGSSSLGARHEAQPAPEQRWGSAAGKEHEVATSMGNHVKPQTLRSKYPLQPDKPVPEPPPNPTRVVAAQARPVQGFDARTSRELPGLRRAYERTFQNADGTQTTEFSESPINFRLPDGSWAPVDTRLLPAGAGGAAAGSASGWRNAADGADLRLAPRADAGSVARLALDADHELAFGLYGATATAARVQGATAVYANAWSDADLHIQALPGGGLKETIVLRSPAAPHSYVFPLRLRGLTARVVGSQVALTDSTGRQRAVVPAGFMEDSRGSGQGALRHPRTASPTAS
jgi:hypothetical protein